MSHAFAASGLWLRTQTVPAQEVGPAGAERRWVGGRLEQRQAGHRPGRTGVAVNPANTTNVPNTAGAAEAASAAPRGPILRFGPFELDTNAELLLRNGRTIRLQPQPFKLLRLLAETSGRLVTREEIQAALWKGDTFVDFEQGVNFAVKQVRDALGEDAERPAYIQTVPKRGYRFAAPVEVVVPGGAGRPPASTDPRLHKAIWANIAELRMLEARRKQRSRILAVILALATVVALSALLSRIW